MKKRITMLILGFVLIGIALALYILQLTGIIVLPSWQDILTAVMAAGSPVFLFFRKAFSPDAGEPEEEKAYQLELEREVKDREAVIEELNTRLGEMQAGIEERDRNIEALRGNIDTLENEVEAKVRRYNMLRAEISTRTDEQSALEKRIEEQKRKIEGME